MPLPVSADVRLPFSALFALERIFEATDGILNLALYLVGPPSDSSLASPTALPTVCLTVPLISFAEPMTRSLSIISSSINALNGRGRAIRVIWLPFFARLRRSFVVVVDLDQLMALDGERPDVQQ